jgi:photosystem II stability/assembly factor-like uncharacterized protein
MSNVSHVEADNKITNKSSGETIGGQDLIRRLEGDGVKESFHVLSDRIWILRESGRVWKTDDAGQHWNRKVFGDDKSVGPISFYGEKYGYALSISNKDLWHTQNQGETWEKVGKFSVEEKTDPLFPFIDGVETMHFFDGRRGIAGGGPYQSLGLKAVRMWITEDGGKNWKEKYNPISSYERATIYDFFFLNDQIGWAAGVNCLMKTADSGQTWQPVTKEPLDYFLKSQWLDEKVGWLKSQNSYYVITNDGGNSWKIYRGRNMDALYLVKTGKEGVSLSENGELLYLAEGKAEWLVQGNVTIYNKDYREMINKNDNCLIGNAILEKLRDGRLVAIWYGVNNCKNREAVGFKHCTSSDDGISWK